MDSVDKEILLGVPIIFSFMFLMVTFGIWEAEAIANETYIEYIQRGYVDAIEGAKYIFSRIY